jgi:hypothetical protein
MLIYIYNYNLIIIIIKIKNIMNEICDFLEKGDARELPNNFIYPAS